PHRRRAGEGGEGGRLRRARCREQEVVQECRRHRGLPLIGESQLPQKTLQDMLHGHLQMVTEQVVALLKHDTPSLIAAYDKNSEHMMMLADALTSGIAKQFPDKFRG